MAGPAQSGVLIYAMYLELVSRFYEQVLPAAVLLADAEHRVRELASRVTRAVGVDAIPALTSPAWWALCRANVASACGEW